MAEAHINLFVSFGSRSEAEGYFYIFPQKREFRRRINQSKLATTSHTWFLMWQKERNCSERYWHCLGKKKKRKVYDAHARIPLPVKWLEIGKAFIQVVVNTHYHPRKLAMFSLGNDGNYNVTV